METAVAAVDNWADGEDGGKNEGMSVPDGLAAVEADRPEGLDVAETDQVIVKLADKASPYESAGTFEQVGLKAELLKGIYNMGFNVPSAIQAKSLPMILGADGLFKNLIAQGHTGSGKTACFVLAMLNRVDVSAAETQALCLVPTRELARQIETVVKKIGEFTKATCHLAIPLTDTEKSAQRQSGASRSRGISAHIVIGTAGRMADLLKRGDIKKGGIKIFVLDEADHMVCMQGMGDRTTRITAMLPSTTQRLLFSATYADDVRELAKVVAPDANEITIKKEKVSIDNVNQYFIDAGSADARFEIVNDIYDLLQLGQTIVFMQTRRDAQMLTNQLREGGQTVGVLTGGEMGTDERDRVIDEFRAGTTRVLVSTNVLSRGVDVPAVTAIINYDLPTERDRRGVDMETYIHRCGRAGRFGRKGIAINLVFDETSKAMIESVAKFYGKPIVKVDGVEELEARLKSDI